MSRWYDKLTGRLKSDFWRRYSPVPSGERVIGPKPERPKPSPLQRLARRRAALKRSGAEFRGECPSCKGQLVVGLTAWRCLGCGSQEVHGADQAGFDAAYPAMQQP